jgi:predicted nicotinamide N-methyase
MTTRHSRLTTHPALLPIVPGGWTKRVVDLGSHSFELALPADPDAFLDDPRVLAEHEVDGYMPYWPYLWPAAIAMARCVLSAGWPAGLPTLEIGAGVGLVGLAAAAAGCAVIVSDYRQTAVDLAVHNARRNGLDSVSGLLLDWRSPPPLPRFRRILACDVVYETGNHAPILDLLERVLTRDGVAWIGDAGRQHASAFIAAARQRGFSVRLSDADGRSVAAARVGGFQLIQIKR